MIRLYRTAWGLVGPGLPWDDLGSFARDAAAEGYAGVEFALPILAGLPGGVERQIAAVGEACGETGLAILPLIATRPERPRDYGDAALHLASFRAQLALAVRLGARRAVVHGGADAFSHDAAVAFFREAGAMAAEAGVLPLFETHRGRPLNDPWRTAAVLAALPDLWLTSDLSHWMPVVDRWPEDCMDLFEAASARTAHLHARIGHEKGPQIPEPRDPLWEAHIALHRRWWEISVRAAEARGEVLTAAPEFGPPPYMAAEPFTGRPVTDLVAANGWMRDRLRDWFGATPT